MKSEKKAHANVAKELENIQKKIAEMEELAPDTEKLQNKLTEANNKLEKITTELKSSNLELSQLKEVHEHATTELKEQLIGKTEELNHAIERHKSLGKTLDEETKSFSAQKSVAEQNQAKALKRAIQEANVHQRVKYLLCH